MLQLLSSPSMAVNFNPRFLSSSSVLVAGGLAVKRHGFALKPTTMTVKLSVKSRQTDFFEKQRFGDSSSSPSYSSQNAEGLPARFYVGHSIYKGKAALTVEPRAPEFVALDSGAFKLSKDGFLLLQFAPSAGVRQYDWSKKQVFSLSVTEIGTLVSLGPRESCEFFHDPFKGKSDEGKVRKVLKVEPLPDGSGHFFNLSVQNKLLNVDENIYIPITRAEFAVLISAFNFVLPYLIGWHAFANSIKPEDANRTTNNASPNYGGDYEWNR
ncbi:Single-stranded DNA-binding protein WHY1 [Cardamine amara subsp. amara]|uniref:Single-stranded DNA-binding protein WHY1 n=1 Tax=Cardamine amara subsp. amara TaxID=228776 RepID=A0ABD1A6Y2_CARAN